MAYSKDLGNVKGKTGAFVKPKEVIRAPDDPSKTIIKWELKNEGNEETISDSEIQTVYFIPYIDNDDPYTLKWRANIDGIGTIDSMPLPRGQAGIPGVNIEVIPSYTDITDDLDRIRYHYNGEYGNKTNYEQIEEGTIFLILNNPDPNDSTQFSPIAYVYDKERDTYNGETPDYRDDAFISIEHPIDLTNYYSKAETYSREEISDMFGQIVETQDRIINILSRGLIQFEVETEIEEPDINTTPEEPDTGD